VGGKALTKGEKALIGGGESLKNRGLGGGYLQKESIVVAEGGKRSGGVRGGKNAERGKNGLKGTLERSQGGQEELLFARKSRGDPLRSSSEVELGRRVKGNGGLEEAVYLGQRFEAGPSSHVISGISRDGPRPRWPNMGLLKGGERNAVEEQGGEAPLGEHFMGKR